MLLSNFEDKIKDMENNGQRTAIEQNIYNDIIKFFENEGFEVVDWGDSCRIEWARMTISPRLYGMQLFVDARKNELMLCYQGKVIVNGKLTNLPVIPLVYAYLKPEEEKL